ncbi:phosphohydrolase [Arthrobacter deserti]|uniref:Phosphohydrolase n=1 Tax=Arthrobacter deserti TaxID=1742687 RepID=A0ABX1JN99_9MICC|nr:phosphohydrolase [Arthrobacter deserti]
MLGGCAAPRAPAAPDGTPPPTSAAAPSAPASSAAADPGSPKAASVHFTAAGDFSASPEAAAVLAATARLRPDLGLALGDLSYGQPGGERDWCGFVTNAVGAGFPFQLLAGNHESDGGNGSIDEFVRCLPNRLPGLVGTYGRQWYVDVPRKDPVLRLVMISPGLEFADTGATDYEAGSAGYRWTAQAIDSARDADIPWVVVGAHKPCHSIGRYGCDLGEDLANLLVQKKVDLVLHGHEHLYQRTHQLGPGPDCPWLAAGTASQACIRDKSGSYRAGAGTVFATVGTGGKELRGVNPQDPDAPYFAAYSGANANPAYGLLDVRVTRTGLPARFVPADGGFRDAFTLSRR